MGLFGLLGAFLRLLEVSRHRLPLVLRLRGVLLLHSVVRPSGQLSGLVEAAELLENVEGVGVCRLTAADVVRHPLVQRVINAYSSKKVR